MEGLTSAFYHARRFVSLLDAVDAFNSFNTDKLYSAKYDARFYEGISVEVYLANGVVAVGYLK